MKELPAFIPASQIHEELIHGPIIRPHPAREALRLHPSTKSMILDCGMCGDEWSVPINQNGSPDVDRFGKEILSCPACGTVTQNVLE